MKIRTKKRESGSKKKGRVETDYFFPNERKTIRAFSLEEATKKLKRK